MSFEFEPKSAALNMRLPQTLLNALKLKAKAKGVPYTRYVRLLLENDLRTDLEPTAQTAPRSGLITRTSGKSFSLSVTTVQSFA
jgi:hypothetical protein